MVSHGLAWSRILLTCLGAPIWAISGWNIGLLLFIRQVPLDSVESLFHVDHYCDKMIFASNFTGNDWVFANTFIRDKSCLKMRDNSRKKNVSPWLAKFLNYFVKQGTDREIAVNSGCVAPFGSKSNMSVVVSFEYVITLKEALYNSYNISRNNPLVFLIELGCHAIRSHSFWALMAKIACWISRCSGMWLRSVFSWSLIVGWKREWRSSCRMDWRWWKA